VSTSTQQESSPSKSIEAALSCINDINCCLEYNNDRSRAMVINKAVREAQSKSPGGKSGAPDNELLRRRPKQSSTNPTEQTSSGPQGSHANRALRPKSKRESEPGPRKDIEKYPLNMSAGHSYDDGPSPSIPQLPQNSDGASEVDITDLEIYEKWKDHLKGVFRLPDDHCDAEPKGKSKSKQVMELLEALASMTEQYSTLRMARVAKRTTEIKNALGDVRKSVKRVINMGTGLKLNTTRNLAAVYLDIIPSFIDAISMGVKAHTTTESVNTASIGEIANLLGLVCNLAWEATCQSDKLQPNTSDGIWKLRRPTTEILSTIGAVHQRFTTEFKTRQQAQDRAEQERITTELKRRRQLKDFEEEQRRSEKRIRMNNLHREQRQIIVERLAKLAPRSMMEGARADANSDSGRKESMYRTNTSDMTRFSHPLATLDYEEVSRNDLRAAEGHTEHARASNRRKEYHSARWSYEEKIVFVETMRSEQGNVPGRLLGQSWN
jgi:hypothetical protein